MVTPAFAGHSGRLVINAQTRPSGAVRVAVANGQDDVYTGFGKDDCVAFEGDVVAHAVQWRGGTLPRETFRKLHIYLKDADLFSFGLSD